MDEKDKLLCNALQKDFSLCKRPFQKIANALGIPEEEVINRVKTLEDAGVIRKLGAIVDVDNIGYVSILVAAEVPVSCKKNISSLINSYPGVTHNYLREGSPNLWFTMIAPDNKTLDALLAEIEKKAKIKLLKLRKQKSFKIKVRFDL